MTMHDQALRELAEKLEPGAETEITGEERAVLRGALAQLAAAQGEIVSLRRLLAIHRESGARIDAALEESLRALGAWTAAPAPAGGYDFAGANEARRALVDATHDAEAAQEVTAAALVFARDLLILLGNR
ncbi:MAG: hypothetical protein EA379_07830 [Phycisphaerales bacterium]|nr:MAG: hypothetical protein EA379_07830 [Phycisphaerales bacterium]